MTDKATLLALAERVEKAEGADRELDYWIMTRTLPTGHAYLWDPADSNHRYTSSLDAALTLVPEGCDFEVGRYAANLHKATAWDRGYYDDAEPCFAATPALALTTAAIRAHASQK